MFTGVTLVAVFATLLCVPNFSGARQSYAKGDEVPVYTDAIFSLKNRFEKFDFYHLPFCRPTTMHLQRKDLSDIFFGSNKKESVYRLEYATNKTDVLLCNLTLSSEQQDFVSRFIRLDYVFNMYVDGIEILHPIGFMLWKKVELVTGLVFEVFFAADRILHVTIEPHKRQEIALPFGPQEIHYSYSVVWYEVNEEQFLAGKRWLHTTENAAVKWTPVANTLVVAALLSSIVLLLLRRTLRNDVQVYGSLVEETEQQPGWKALHADVFRFPRYPMLLSSLLGCGTHLILFTLAALGIAMGKKLVGMQSLSIAQVVLLFVLTAPASGYVSGSFYRRLEGKHWSRNALLTFWMLPGQLSLVWVVLNIGASIYGSTFAVSWVTLLYYLFLLLGTTFPLVLFGAILGKRRSGPFDAPTRTKFVPREVPELRWYQRTVGHFFAVGLFSFVALCTELHYMVFCLVTYGAHMSPAFGLILLVALFVVNSSINVALTYERLSAENHRWWWSSALCGGSISMYICVYSIVFVLGAADVNRGFHCVICIGYIMFICYCLFIAMATVGFISSLVFVKQMYESIKKD